MPGSRLAWVCCFCVLLIRLNAVFDTLSLFTRFGCLDFHLFGISTLLSELVPDFVALLYAVCLILRFELLVVGGSVSGL